MDDALVICRLLHYGSALFLFGISAFQLWVVPRALKPLLDLELGRIVRAAALMGFVSAIAWLLVASGEMGEGLSDVWNPATWYSVLRETEFGQVWLFHLLLAAAVLAFFISRRDQNWRIATGLSAFNLGSLGFVGHAAMLEGVEGWISRASHVVHLLAAGFWLGGLIPLTLCLGKRAAVSSSLQRFSGLGHVAVATVIGSGLVNVALVLGRWPTDTSSPYQVLLLAKLALVAAMVGLALVNRYVLTPKLRRSDAALRGLRYCTLGELILGSCVVTLVSVFGNLPPQ